MSAAPVSQRKRVPAAERRASILRAAGPVFARDGYAATRLDDVAAAAGITKPILYRHFESKKALYLALLTKHREDMPTFFRRLDVDPQHPPDEVLRAILDHWLDYVRDNSHAWLMLFRDSSGDEEVRAYRREVSARARELLAAFVAAQSDVRIPPDQVEPTAELLRSGLAGLALWWIERPDVPKQTVLDVAARLSAAAVAA
jgi:AcrR family transcriptional regulator